MIIERVNGYYNFKFKRKISTMDGNGSGSGFDDFNIDKQEY